MPKGDYLQLKADIEDGTVPIAHLLLEAASMAKLNGVAKGLLLFIWRRTYGWADEGKRKHKDDRIKLAEFAQATGSARTYVSTQLKLLVKARVIREMPDPENGRYKRYGMNTEVSEWHEDVLDIDELHQAIESKLYVHSSRSGTTLTVQQTRNGSTNAEGLANAERFNNSATKRFSDHETFMSDKPSHGAGSSVSKESIERNKKDLKIVVDQRNEIELALRKKAYELYPAMGMSAAVIYDLADMLITQTAPVELGIEAINVTKNLGKDEGFARNKLRRWLQKGILTADDALKYEQETFSPQARGQPKVNIGTRDGPRKQDKPDERYTNFYELYPDMKPGGF